MRRLSRARPNRKKGEKQVAVWGALQWITMGLKVAAGAVGLTVLTYSVILIHDYATQCAFFAAQNVAITGNRRLPNKEVLTQAGLYRGVNVLSVNLSVAKKQLEAHPWVQSADVQRQLPDGLMVTIAEHEPLAVIDIGERFLINTQGNIFKRLENADPQALPVVKGLTLNDVPLAGQERNRLFEAVMNILEMGQNKDCVLPNGQIRSILVDRDLGVTLDTEGRFGVVKLGFNQYAEKYALLDTTFVYLSQNMEVTQIQWVDLNDPSRIVVTPIKTLDADRRKKGKEV